MHSYVCSVCSVQICALLSENGWTSVWLNEQAVPYMYRGEQWVAYDNVDSVTYKARPTYCIIQCNNNNNNNNHDNVYGAVIMT